MNKKSYSTLLLCLVPLLVYLACQKDDAVTTEQSTQQKVPKIETISYDDSKNTIFNNLKNRYNLENHKASALQSKSTTDTLGLIIETDIIKQVTLGDYTSYTMKIVDQDSVVFYNLTIEYKNGESDMFITKYTPTEYWLNNKDQPFEGTVKSRGIRLTLCTDPEEPFDEDLVNDPGNPDLGAGSGGGGGSYIPEYSPYYPTECNGIVLITYEDVPYPCSCEDHMPWQTCYCVQQGGTGPGYHQVPMYYCQENSDPGDYNPDDPDDSYNPGGVTQDPIPDDPAITVSILPIDCLGIQTTDADAPCYVDPYDYCRLNNSVEVCDCEAAGGNLDDCIYEEVASTALFKKKGEDDEAIPANLEFALPCFDTENNQNGYHDVTIYVKQPVPNSSQISAGLGDAGHTFIELAQSVNGNVVRQFIGLYPANSNVSPNNPIVDGIFIDDSEEEYDVSLRIELSPEQFNNIIDYLTSFGDINEYGDIININPQYDLNEFNCSDFGLNIMNFTDIQIPDSTGEWGGEYGYDLGQGTCPALLGQDIRNTDFGANVQINVDGGVSGSSTENLCDD